MSPQWIKVLAGTETLMHQASMTADSYLTEAVKRIDTQFGKGFAKKHPELVGSFIQTAALDYLAAMVKAGAQDIRDAINNVAERQ